MFFDFWIYSADANVHSSPVPFNRSNPNDAIGLGYIVFRGICRGLTLHSPVPGLFALMMINAHSQAPDLIFASLYLLRYTSSLYLLMNEHHGAPCSACR